MAIFFVASLPYTLVPFNEKVEAAKIVVKDVGYIQTYKATLLSELFPLSVIYLSRPLSMLLYTLWSTGLIIRFYTKKKVTAIFPNQNFVAHWLILLLGFFFIVVLTHTLLIIRFFSMKMPELFFTLNILRMLSGAGLIGLFVTPLLFPAILYGLPRIPESELSNVQEENQGPSFESNELKKINHFNSKYFTTISERADSFMKESKPYLQPDFNLAQLSVQIQIPEHHLGYFFREVKKQHFTDYRNEWRIEHAKKLINDGKVNDYTLEAIASLSGFSNRNSFRITFQKIEGISPSTFASQIKE
ncbi:helix-turn-helix domain-containing protein [Saccharicrinis sp. FJH62]|uniref:helix-turn-helix domain-containing protein n=1 Tax=Saccharicrinis sp. FJH62 TaxID=3344657 RepID=UPI0035D3EBD0